MSHRNLKGRVRRIHKLWDGGAFVTIKLQESFDDDDGDKVTETKNIEFMVKGRDAIAQIEAMNWGTLICFDTCWQAKQMNTKVDGKYPGGKAVKYGQSELILRFTVKEEGKGRPLGQPAQQQTSVKKPTGKAPKAEQAPKGADIPF